MLVAQTKGGGVGGSRGHQYVRESSSHRLMMDYRLIYIGGEVVSVEDGRTELACRGDVCNVEFINIRHDQRVAPGHTRDTSEFQWTWARGEMVDQPITDDTTTLPEGRAQTTSPSIREFSSLVQV